MTNKEEKVQECDATMLINDIMPVHKKDLTFK